MSSNRLPVKSFSQKMLYSAICSALTVPAFAQTADTSVVPQLQTISVEGSAIEGYQAHEVNSPKMTAPLLDTPRTINVIPEEVIKDRGATSLQDVLRTTPGITLGSGEGGTPTGDRPFIRGYEASTDIFIDGLRDYARGSHETFNLESVEVIKGPSSAYTGRGGTGGSINLVTKSPSLTNFAEGSAGIGNGGQHRLTIDGNYVFSETGAVRLNMMRMGGDMPGRDYVKMNRWGIAPSVAFGLGTPTRVILSYSHIENNDTPDMGIPFVNASNPDRVSPIKVDRENYYGRTDVDFRENKFDTATAQLEHDITSQLTLRNTTRYSTSLNHYLFTRPSFDNCKAGAGGSCAAEDAGLQFTRADRMRWRKSESLINQTDLFGTFTMGSLTHSFATGLEFSKEEISSKAMTGGPGPDTDSFWSPNANRTYNSVIAYGPKIKDGDIKTQSAYFFDTMEINEQWSVNAGVRYDKFKVADAKSGDARSDGLWNYQAGVVFKPAPNGSVYVSYGTSSNPAGENFGQAGGADGPAGGAKIHDLKPEKSRSWELGTKWDLMEDKLSLAAAVFQTDKTDARSTDPLTGDVSLAGSNRVRGLELSATGAITPKWDVWAGYTYLDPKVKNYRNGSNVFDGNQIKFIAKNSASLWTTYKVHPQWTVGGGVTYVGQRYVDDANKLKLPSHTVYDAMVRFDVNKQFDLQLNVNNIGNTRVYDASHVGVFANVGPGRSYMLNATYRFE